MNPFVLRDALRRTICAFAVAACVGACGSKLNQENFTRVKQGMTQQEVAAILGEPTETNSIGIGGLSGSAAMWTDGQTTISIQFLNDKVQLKQLSKQSDQPAAR